MIHLENLNSLRAFYRKYLSKYWVFRIIKKILLFIYFRLIHLENLNSPRAFYRKYLSKYWVFRIIKKILLFIYFRYPKLISRLSNVFKKNLLMHYVPIHKLRTINKRVISTSFKRKKIRILGPRFIGNIPTNTNYPVEIDLNPPQIDLAILKNVSVMGRTNLIIGKREIGHPDALIPERDVIRPELFEVASLSSDYKKISLKVSKRPARKVSQAISLVGQCSGNYAHWLVEILPKLIVIDGFQEYNRFSLLIDDWLHPNIRSSIELLGANKRDIVEVTAWEKIEVEELVYISDTAYIPFEARSYVEKNVVPKPDPTLFTFHDEAFFRLRDVAEEISQLDTHTKHYPKNIFLTRNSAETGQGRCIVNNSEIENLATKSGFAIINTSKLTFSEQIKIFANAQSIVSPIGASLVNGVFSKPGRKILILSPYFEGADYYFFSNLLNVLGHDTRYVVGPQEKNSKVHVAHRDYEIDGNTFLQGLKWCLN